MAMEPRVTEQPLFHLRGLVGAVVVEDQVDPQIGGDDPVDVPQEADEVDAPVAALELADDLARDDVHGREQRRRAVAPVVVGARPGVTEFNGNDRCVRSSAWIWVRMFARTSGAPCSLSSTHSTSALSGKSK